MKLHIFCALAALLPCSLYAANYITIEAKVIQSKSRGTLPHSLQRLNELRSVDILSAPHITSRSGQSTTVAITRDFRAMSVAPSKHPMIPQGVILRITPHSTRNGVSYTAHVTFRALDSVTGGGAPPVSTFTTRELYASGTPKIGEEVWLDFPSRDGKATSILLVFKRKNA